MEDPFDAPTYHIPEKPVTFTEGASYSLIILAGLGIAGIAAYGVFKELIFEPKEYVIPFNYLTPYTPSICLCAKNGNSNCVYLL